MIVCVSANPALDLRLRVPRIAAGAVQRADRVRSPGSAGKRRANSVRYQRGSSSLALSSVTTVISCSPEQNNQVPGSVTASLYSVLAPR